MSETRADAAPHPHITIWSGWTRTSNLQPRDRRLRVTSCTTSPYRPDGFWPPYCSKEEYPSQAFEGKRAVGCGCKSGAETARG